MGLLGPKRRKLPRRELEYRRALRAFERELPAVESREFKMYKKFDQRPRSWYERYVGFAGGVISLTPEKRTGEHLQSAIAFTGLRVAPAKVMGSFLFTVFIFALLGVFLAVSQLVPAVAALLVAVIGVPIGYYILRYPLGMVKNLRIRASAEVVLAILYMVVSMRISPNLERALRFAASNLTGELAWDLRRLLWDIELGKYHSADEAIDRYVNRWKEENEEFAEGLRLIKDSESQSYEKSREILDQALEVVLEGTKTRMKHYAQDLRMPVLVIHMMGIVLPILGSIMAPLAAVFLANAVTPMHFILGYDIILPVVLLWFISTTLNKRPVTFSAVDISRHPSLPKPGSFRFKGRSIPALPVALLILLAVVVWPVLYFAQQPDLLLTGKANDQFSSETLLMSLLLILGTGLSISVYMILSTFQRARIQDDIQNIESEFELALFQLGNRISGGTPTEVAVGKALEDVKDLKIADFFRLTLRNMRTLGMTFENALFNKQWGALRYYPSRLLKNIMYAVTDTARKGVAYASESMLRISRYLKNIRETQEYIRDLLSESTSSMKFQAYFLTPLITGLIVSISDVIVQVLVKLGDYLENDLGFTSQSGFAGIGSLFGDVDAAMAPATFQLIVGVYLIQVIIILAIFITKISKGENKIDRDLLMGKMLLIGIFAYVVVVIAASSIFGDMIKAALSGLIPA